MRSPRSPFAGSPVTDRRHQFFNLLIRSNDKLERHRQCETRQAFCSILHLNVVTVDRQSQSLEMPPTSIIAFSFASFFTSSHRAAAALPFCESLPSRIITSKSTIPPETAITIRSSEIADKLYNTRKETPRDQDFYLESAPARQGSHQRLQSCVFSSYQRHTG